MKSALAADVDTDVFLAKIDKIKLVVASFQQSMFLNLPSEQNDEQAD